MLCLPRSPIRITAGGHSSVRIMNYARQDSASSPTLRNGPCHGEAPLPSDGLLEIVSLGRSTDFTGVQATDFCTSNENSCWQVLPPNDCFSQNPRFSMISPPSSPWLVMTEPAKSPSYVGRRYSCPSSGASLVGNQNTPSVGVSRRGRQERARTNAAPSPLHEQAARGVWRHRFVFVVVFQTARRCGSGEVRLVKHTCIYFLISTHPT